MKLNPRQAPLYGSCVLTVQLSDEELCDGQANREELEYFLLFTGSTQRHVSSTLRISHDTLQLACPAHDCCESVVVTLCCAAPDGLVHHLSTEHMCFVQDLALDMAQFLVSTVGQADVMEGALLLEECHIPLQECEKMDQSLSLALTHLTLPPDWSLLGDCNAPEPQETLLHFAARRGLQRVARFLLRQPGARQALALPDRAGETPISLAQSRGHGALLELLTREEAGAQDSTEKNRRINSGPCVVRHHPCLNTYTLSVAVTSGTPAHGGRTDVQDLRCLIHRDSSRAEERSAYQLQTESPSRNQNLAWFEQHNADNTSEERFTPVPMKGNEKEHDGCLGLVQSSEVRSPTDDGESDEKRACACENIEKDYGAQVQSVAAREARDSSDGLQSGSEGESTGSSCGKQREETDRAQHLISQVPWSTGPEREVQEKGGKTDVDQNLEISQHVISGGDMGISQSLDTTESSDVESCSQSSGSSDEGEGESSVELEETEKDLVDSASDQGSNVPTSRDWNESSADMIRSAADRTDEENVSYTSHELAGDRSQTGPDEQGESTTRIVEVQEERLCLGTETESNHRGESDSTPEDTCQNNDSAQGLQSPLDTQTPSASMFELGDASSVTVDVFSENNSNSETKHTEAAASEKPDLTQAATRSRSEHEGHVLERSTDITLVEPDPESPTQSVSHNNPEQNILKSRLLDVLESQVSEMTGNPECRTPNIDANVQPHKTDPVPADYSEEVSEQRCSPEVDLEGTRLSAGITTQECHVILKEVQPCLNHNDSVGGSKEADPVVSLVSLEEQSRIPEHVLSSVSVDPDHMVTETEEIQETEVDLQHIQKEIHGFLEDQPDLQTQMFPDANVEDVSTIHREGHSLCLDGSTCSSGPLEKRHSSESTESSRSPARHSTGSATLRDSGSDTDGFLSTDTGEDSVFRKGQEVVGASDSASEVSVSCSSTDDTASLCRPSSLAESYEDLRRRVGGGAAAGGGAEAEEEANDRVTEVPLRSSLLRPSVRSLSPFRRHSWGPGKNLAGEEDMNQRSSVRRTPDQKPVFHRRSLSWCPIEAPFSSDLDKISQLLSVSLEGLAAKRDDGKQWQTQGTSSSQSQLSEDTGSQVSLNEEGMDSDLGDSSSLDILKLRRSHRFRRTCQSMTLPLRESVSMLSISQRDIDARARQKRRISFALNISPILRKSKRAFVASSSSSDEEDSVCMRSFASTSNSLRYSITEEEPGSLRMDFGEKSENKVSRTFSYLKNKMIKKSREKDKDKSREKDKEARDREKKVVNGHVFSSMCSLHAGFCQHCNKNLNAKDSVSCSGCSVWVHKSCQESIPPCTKGMAQLYPPDPATMPGVTLRAKPSAPRERPWSAILSPEHQHPLLSAPRRHTSIMQFNSGNLSKSMSINNIAVFDEMPLMGLRHLSQSTDSLAKVNKVIASTESLIDEGTGADEQLMGDFETDAKELEADLWSSTTDKEYLKKLKKNAIKKQEVIYELIQTEMHHLRTLRIMSDVYCKGLVKELHLETQTVECVFPALDELLKLHTDFFSSLIERRREAKQSGAVIISRIGDLLVNQFSGSNAERMKKVYSKFCSRHNEAVNLYKELHAKDKRFQSFIRNKMSSSIVRRMGIPDCILLVTQRITKYPVLLQRILQHTKDSEEDSEDLTHALQLVKEVIAAVDSKVNEHKKRRRLEEIYSRTDSRSIMRMKSGQMFAREDLIRGRRLIHDGPLQLKTTTGRLKDVQALLLSNVLVFLQEKDQKYVFASLDRRATVISLHKLIVREVANEDRGLFLIATGIEQPEMVEVHAASRDERNTWMQLIQDAMQSIEKDEDEGIPSETEEDKKLLESKAKEMRDMLHRKDDQILTLLQEKVKLFHDMCGPRTAEDSGRTLFRACSEDGSKGNHIMKEAIREVEMLQTLVHSGLGGAAGQQGVADAGNAASVFLPRRSETFGGFDSHQMSSSKHGDKEEVEDLRRTESDNTLKKGGNTNLLLLLKRNREEVLSSVTNLHDLLNSLQAVVVQQDTCLEEQRQALSERQSSRPPSRLPSLVEQEKQRSAERQRQELAAHTEERRRKEKEWEVREKELSSRESVLQAKEKEAQRRRGELEDAQRELQSRKEDYQKDLERLRDAQRKLEREKEQMQREVDMLEQARKAERTVTRTVSNTSEDSANLQSSGSAETKQEQDEAERSFEPRKDSLTRMDSKQKGRNLNPFSSFTPKALSAEGQSQIPNRLLQLTRPKDKKDKKKKKSKSKPSQEAESHLLLLTEAPMDTEIFFC